MKLLYATCFFDVSGVTKLNFDILERLKNEHSVYLMTTEKELAGDSWCGRYSSVFGTPFSLCTYPEKERLNACIDYLEKNSIDVIFTTHSLWIYENCGRIRRRLPAIRIVDSLHVLEPFFLRGGFPDISGNRLVHGNLDATIVISEDLRNYLIRNYRLDEARLFVVRNGVDRNFFTNNINMKGKWRSACGFPPHAKIVGFIGRMTIQKRPFLFIDVAKRMIGKDPFLYFYMIGNGPLLEKVESFLARDSIGERIRVLRQCDNIPSVLNSTDLLLLTSSYEGAPLTIIEALSSGVPVVSSDVGAVREYTAGHCHLIRVGRGETEQFTKAALAALAVGEQRRFDAVDIADTAAGYRKVFEHVASASRR